MGAIDMKSPSCGDTGLECGIVLSGMVASCMTVSGADRDSTSCA
jgi:hypothetical protein